MSIFHRRSLTAFAVALGSFAFTASAGAATLAVDDDRAECPNAAYTSIQSAIDAAASGDTIAICPGKYAEGPGSIGSNGLTITKRLALKGAGADLVTISPKAVAIPGELSPKVRGQIASTSPDLHDAVGNIITVIGDPDDAIRVDVSGVTIDGAGVVSEAGLAYLDGWGVISRSRVTNIVTSEGNNAFSLPGGYRNGNSGYGITQVTRAQNAPGGAIRTLYIEATRVDKYNSAGVLISAARDEGAATIVNSGVRNRAELLNSQVVGRTECVSFETDGNCSSVGLLTTGPLLGQDGVRVMGGASTSITGSLVSQNLVNGTGAPTRSTISGAGVVTPNSTNNANLLKGAGVRLVAGASSTIATSNIVDNAYGVANLQADGATAQTSPRVTAENNWWGLNYYRGGNTGSTQAVNPGPGISPTDNPLVPENPVNGASVVDGAGFSSTAVDMFPFRNGPQSSERNGQYIVPTAPMPINDAAPAVRMSDTSAAVGTNVTIGADAEDDFDVKSVTFYEGAKALATQTAPPYAVAVSIAADAACGTRTITAVAEDSSGQTTSEAADITVTGCHSPPDPGTDPGTNPGTPNPGTPNPGTPNPGTPNPVKDKPAVSFAGNTVAVSTKGTEFSITPTAAAGVAKVVYLLGNRAVCTVTAAPFACKVVPTGAETGKQTLRVVLTDKDGVTAETSREVKVARFAAKLSQKVKSGKVKGGKVKKTITGTLTLPKGVTKAQACKSGSVTVVVKSKSKTLVNTQVKLSKSCAFSKSLTIKKAKKKTTFTATAKFAGNAVLLSTSNARRFS